MKKTVRLFWLFGMNSIKTSLQYQSGVVLFLCGKIIRFVIFFLFIYQLLSRTKILAGYTMDQTLIFFLTFNLIDNLSQLLFREVYRFRPMVIHGEIDTILVKPFHPFLRVLTGGIDFMDLLLMLPYTLLLIYFIHKTDNLMPLSVIGYCILLFNAMIIATAVHIFVLVLGLMTTEIDHAMLIYRDISRMGAFPMDIYHEPLRTVLTFVLPIGVMFTFPVKTLIGTLGVPFQIASVCISIALFTTAMLSWNYALKKYQSWGG